MIELQGVSKIYDDGTTAVDDISFSINEGEIFGLIGTSGCGKTTTLKMVNRLIEPTSGQIFLNGRSIQQMPVEKLRRSIGYVIQNVGLFPHYTIEQNVAVVPRLLQWDNQRVEQRTEELLHIVGLEPDAYAHRKPDALSGGQQQRVGLARALAANPELLLMDEPFGALDPITKEQVRIQFQELLAQFKKTVILVTHDVFEAFGLCDRIALMNRGKVLQVGTPKELLFQPRENLVSSFFEGHRFQLEMMCITIRDVLTHADVLMESHSPDVSKDSSNITPDSSIFSALESGGDPVLVREGNEEGNHISKERLLEGFQKVRTKLREGRDG